MIRSHVTKPIKRMLASRALHPVLLRYVASRIVKINDHPRAALGLLVLDRERFWPGDLERLGERTQLYELPSDTRNLLHALFFRSADVSAMRTFEVGPEFRLKEARFVAFLRRLIPALADHVGFDCVVTCNYLYVQNKLIAKACAATRVPFVDINRESKQDVNLNPRFKNKYETLRLHMEFFGHAICVYNDNMKDLLVDLKACDPEKVVVAGALRNDVLVSRARASRNGGRKQVTLFSFRHMPIGSDGIAFQPSGFSRDRSQGFVELFDGTHSGIAEVARRNPDVAFVVKAKWRSGWEDVIRQAFALGGYSLEQLPNVSIVGPEGNAIDLILQSTVVVGLNSMTLVQARLAGVPVVMPYFGELIDKYPDALQYRDVLDEFVVVRSREALIDAVQQHLDVPIVRPARPDVFHRYVGCADGRALDRVMSVLETAVREARP